MDHFFKQNYSRVSERASPCPAMDEIHGCDPATEAGGREMLEGNVVQKLLEFREFSTLPGN